MLCLNFADEHSTALHEATEAPMMELLLAAGADPSASPFVSQTEGDTPLHQVRWLCGVPVHPRVRQGVPGCDRVRQGELCIRVRDGRKVC